MSSTKTLAGGFLKRKEKLFNQNLEQIDSFHFSVEYSLLVEEFIRTLAGTKRYKFILASALESQQSDAPVAFPTPGLVNL